MSSYPQVSGGFLQVSGINVEWDSRKEKGKRINKVTLWSDNSELDPDREYTVATIENIANGSLDGYTFF